MSMKPRPTEDVVASLLLHYGPEHQMEGGPQACAELAETLSGWSRGCVSVEELVDRVAGVAILIEELEMILPAAAFRRLEKLDDLWEDMEFSKKASAGS